MFILLIVCNFVPVLRLFFLDSRFRGNDIEPRNKTLTNKHDQKALHMF